MDVMIDVRHLHRRFGPILAVDDVSFTVARGEVLGFLGPNGAGKSTTMKMITGFLAPTSGTASHLRRRHRRGPDRGQAPDRLSARGRAGLSRHDAGVVPALHRAHPRLRRRRGAPPHRPRGRAHRAPERAGPADRDAVQGLQAPRRPGAGAAARSRRADPRRADRRARPQPEARGARAHQRACAAEGDHHLDPHPRGGRRGVHARHHHRRRPHPRRRHAGRARGALAPPQRGAAVAGARRYRCCRRAHAAPGRRVGRGGRGRGGTRLDDLPARWPLDRRRGQRSRRARRNGR